MSWFGRNFFRFRPNKKAVAVVALAGVAALALNLRGCINALSQETDRIVAQSGDSGKPTVSVKKKDVVLEKKDKDQVDKLGKNDQTGLKLSDKDKEDYASAVSRITGLTETDTVNTKWDLAFQLNNMDSIIDTLETELTSLEAPENEDDVSVKALRDSIKYWKGRVNAINAEIQILKKQLRGVNGMIMALQKLGNEADAKTFKGLYATTLDRVQRLEKNLMPKLQDVSSKYVITTEARKADEFNRMRFEKEALKYPERVSAKGTYKPTPGRSTARR